MRHALLLVFAMSSVLTCLGQEPKEAAPGYKLGDAVKDFSLPDLAGATKSLADYAKGKKLIVIDFWSPRCPYCRTHEDRLTALDKKWREKGVLLLHIASNRNENRTPEEVAKLKAAMKQHGQEFPALIDLDNIVADTFGAKFTPTVFVLDADLKVRYTGAITDDPASGSDVKREYVEEAISALLEGKEPRTPSTKPEG